MFYFFVILYLAWIVLMAIKQFDKNILSLSRFDVFALIPNWTLFAPNPKFSDYKIFYRDQLTDGTIGDLTEIDWINNKRKNFLWKGQMREQKFLSFVSKDTFKYRKNNADLLFFYNNKTLMLKNFVKHYQVPENISGRQLVVVETYGHLIAKRELVVLVTNIKYYGRYRRL